MAVTIKQIAELAGVSTGTVDRALNNRGRVNPQVAERIKKIAKELNYHPNAIAKSLSIKRHKLKIAVILNVSKNRFVETVLTGVELAAHELHAAGFTVEVMKCKDFDVDAQLELIDKAVSEGFAGIVLIPINNERIKARVNELYEEDFPVIFLTSIIEGAKFWSYVGCNYKYSGQISCAILNQITGGSARLAVMISNLQMWSNRQRLLSIEKYMNKEFPGIKIEAVLELSNEDIESYLQAKKLLDERPDINSILYCSGAVDGGLKAVLEVAQQRPVKIVTFDFTETIRKAMYDGHIIFTITQNPNEQGYKALKLMSQYLMDRQRPDAQFHYINTEIMIRESIKDSESL